MEVKKRGKNDSKTSFRSPYPYVTKYGRGFNISARVRDAILPHHFVKVEIDKDTIRLTPTDDAECYKLVMCGNSMARITYSYANNILPIPEKIKIPVEFNDDGSLLLCVRKAGVVV